MAPTSIRTAARLPSENGLLRACWRPPSPIALKYLSSPGVGIDHWAPFRQDLVRGPPRPARSTYRPRCPRPEYPLGGSSMPSVTTAVAVLSGGVGAARFLLGLQDVVDP